MISGVTARDVATLVFEKLSFLSLGNHISDQDGDFPHLFLVHVSGWGCLDSNLVSLTGTRSAAVYLLVLVVPSSPGLPGKLLNSESSVPITFPSLKPSQPDPSS